MGMPKKLEAADESQEMTFIALFLLLLCFMVIMVSMAAMNGPRFRKAIGSVHGAFSLLNNASGENIIGTSGPGILPEKAQERTEDAVELAVAVEKILGDESMGLFQIDITDEGIQMTLGSLVLFDKGHAILKPGASPVLDEVVNFLLDWSGGTAVVGHTCNVPIHTVMYPSNWDLSLARAVEVVRYLESQGMPGERLSAIGKADSKPLVPNASGENRSMNRRVEIILECEGVNGSGGSG